MKNAHLKTTLSFILLMIGMVHSIYSQNYTITKIENIYNNGSTISAGEVIRVKIDSVPDFQPILNKQVFLNFNDKQSKIKAFLKDSSNRDLYFELSEKLMGEVHASQPNPVTGDNKLSFGFENGTNSNALSVTYESKDPQAKIDRTNTLKVEDSIPIKFEEKSKFYELQYLNTNDSLKLYLNNLLMNTSSLKSVDSDQFIMIFQLGKEEVYNEFYDKSATRKLTLGIGTKNSNRLTIKEKINLKFFNNGSRNLSIFLIISWAIFIIVLSIYSNLIRDFNIPKGMIERPFSFARTQLAYWSFLIIGAFIFIWFTTHELAFFPNSALVLLGISVSVTAVGRIIDSRISPAEKMELKPFRKEGEGETKDGIFFKELLSDGSGISIHRVQYFAFNIVLGFVFGYRVLTELQMPSFDDELLSLMGISAATYAGIKGVETHDKNGNSGSRAISIHRGEDDTKESISG